MTANIQINKLILTNIWSVFLAHQERFSNFFSFKWIGWYIDPM